MIVKVLLYLAPLLTLTSVILILLAFISPTLILKTSMALLVISPSSDSSTPIDGPSVFLGIIGSCSRLNNDGAPICTLPAFSPIYDLSSLPAAAPTVLLSAPSPAVPAFVGISLAFTVLFFLSFTLISLRHKMGEKLSASLEKPAVQNISAWIGVFGFFIGLTCFLVIRMWFGKSLQDFNTIVSQSGQVKLTASFGGAFTMAWVAYAFYAVPLTMSLCKLNVKATK